MSSVEIFHFNPKRRIFKGKIGHLIPIKRPVNNFGDLLGLEIVAYILAQASLKITMCLLTLDILKVGSILHFAKTDDVVW